MKNDEKALDAKEAVQSTPEATPIQRKRYKLSELLEGVTEEKMDQLRQATAGALEGNPVGRELG